MTSRVNKLPLAATGCLLFLVGLSLNQASLSEASKSYLKPIDVKQNSTTQQNGIPDNRTSMSPATREQLDSAPSITSVHHQVWTSSSSGSLDELSPEIIGKLRQDVPFLAAYALRPRIVGGLGGALAAPTLAPLLSASIQAPPSSVEVRAAGDQQPQLAGTKLHEAASSPREARQTANGLAGHKSLGDQFSEFNVETSSTSRSEHHHKRKTSLKRAGEKEEVASLGAASLKRSKQWTADRPIISKGADKRAAQRGANSRETVLRRGRTARRKEKRGSKREKKASRARSAKRSSRVAKSRAKLAKLSGKIEQADPMDKVEDEDEEQNSIGTTVKPGQLPAAQTGVKGGSSKGGAEASSGTKGGSSGTSRRPFYATNRTIDSETSAGPKEKKLEPPSNEPGLINEGANEAAVEDKSKDKDGPDAGFERDEAEPDSENELDANSEDEASQLDDEPRGEPRRVGDDDVEEDGDTLLVEPKSDGVDDDPELPTGQDPEAAGPEAAGPDSDVDREREQPTERPASGGSSPETEPRGRRVNRERPNGPRGSGRDESDGGGPSSAAGAGGGGFGASLGGGGATPGATGSGRPNGPDAARESPGVEFADRDEDRDAEDEDQREEDRRRTGPGSSGGAGASGVNGAARGFGSRNGPQDDSLGGETDIGRTRGTKEGSSDGRQGSMMDIDDDLDYRDESELEDVGRRRGSSGAAPPKGGEPGGRAPGREPGEDDKDEEGGSLDAEDDRRASRGDEGARKRPAGKAGNEDCTTHDEDGSYKAHDEKYHERHHQTVDWLRGSIAGEPDDDYPILDRATNRTNFSCSQQQHPGYYADVEARCQIFHICQPDGRQDSFICPNGTIFSQKTLVCVWWNGFDCEDAPKFYYLNELLYKSASAKHSPQAAALPAYQQNKGSGVMQAAGNDDRLSQASPSGLPEKRQGPLRPRTMPSAGLPANDDDDYNDDGKTPADSSIDSLLRAMRKRNEGKTSPKSNGEAAERGEKIDSGSNLGNRANGARGDDRDDESTIQRKSTFDGDDEESHVAEKRPGLSNRLREGNNVPRRKRRASPRQAPPRLKSRRVSRNSRRRKLRHGVKPKRRA